MCVARADVQFSMDSVKYLLMKEYRTRSKCKIHLFLDTTALLMFALGARTIVPGELQLYEYNPKEDSYTISLAR